MPAPLHLGSALTTLPAPTAPQIASLVGCGPLNLDLLNGLIKLIGSRLDANTSNLDILNAAIDDRVSTAVYNSLTKTLNLSFIEGGGISIDITGILADAQEASFPAGVIAMWSGSALAIPVGFALCNGSNGTPNLTGRFVMGLAPGYAIGSTGGAIEHDHGATGDGGDHGHGGATGSTVLTEAQIPAHDHPNGVGDNLSTSFVYSTVPGASSSNMNNDAAAGTVQGMTGEAGGGEGHTHTISDSGVHSHSTANGSSLPPYYVLAYIMKV